MENTHRIFENARQSSIHGHQCWLSSLCFDWHLWDKQTISWLPRMLTFLQKLNRLEISRTRLSRLQVNLMIFISRLMSQEKVFCCFFYLEINNQRNGNKTILFHIKFQICFSVGKLIYDSLGISWLIYSNLSELLFITHRVTRQPSLKWQKKSEIVTDSSNSGMNIRKNMNNSEVFPINQGALLVFQASLFLSRL